MESQIFFNSLIGTNYESNKYFFEIYDMKENNYYKEPMNEILFEKINKNDKNLKYDNDIKIDAYCFDCKKNINLKENFNCKNHNNIILNDLNKDINIESIEKNLNLIIENYEKILGYLEDTIINLKKRNNNQIKLAKKIIETYKTNIDNLNYQIISNTKNILNFNDINYKLIIQKDLPINLEYNIIKEYPISNYLKETISIEKIQKNFKIEFDIKNSINCVILFPNENKLIFNSNKQIFLLNTKIYKIVDKIESDTKIIFMNLMDDKKTILISHENSIEKLTIEKDKLNLENFLSTNVHIHRPGVIINYKKEYAWTNGINIGFINDKYYNIMDSSEEVIYGGYSGGYRAKIVNLFQYKDDILFIFNFCGFNHHMDSLSSIRMGSYLKETNFNKCMHLEEFGARVAPQTDYKIYCLKNNELIICAKQHIYIIDYINWTIKKEVRFSNRIIKNSYYLNDFCFLLFFEDFVPPFEYEIIEHEKQNNIGIMKIVGNDAQFIYQNLYNEFERKIIYYNFNGNCEQYGLNQNIISVTGNCIELYHFINIKKSFEIENNKN